MKLAKAKTKLRAKGYHRFIVQASLVIATIMKNTYCLFQIKFITEYTNVQQVIITQILLKQFN